MNDFFDNITIVGSGAVGLTLAGYFSDNKIPLNLLIKSKKTQEMLGQKLQVSLPSKSECFKTTINCNTIAAKQIDCLIVCVKAYGLIDVLSGLKPNLAKNCLVVLVQNGMGFFKACKALLPKQKIIVMSCLFGARVTGFNQVVLSNAPEVIIGDLLADGDQSQLNRFGALLSLAKIKAKQTNDILASLQFKLVINASLNAMGAIHNKSHKQLFKSTELKNKVKQLCLESTNILNHNGFEITPEKMWLNLLSILPSIASNYSSMLADKMNSKPTEIKYINGYLVDLADKFGVSCPFNKAVVAEVASFV